MGFGEYLRGRESYTLIGADPESCLNRLTRQGIPIGDVERQDPFTLTFSAPVGYETHIHTVCESSYCHEQLTHRQGFKEDLKGLLRRPWLLLSLTVALVLTFLMESLIWKIEIQAEDDRIKREILYTLKDHGIDIWSRSRAVDPQALRYTLLNELSELSWVAVNVKGGRLMVFSLEQEEAEVEGTTAPQNLIAVRDGVITDSVVLEGMPLVKVGDSVVKGQILISGFEDYGIYMKAVEAEGEIRGQTWYQGTVVTPSVRGVKEYTGRTWQVISIIFGRKSINLSGSSSNLGVTCDKIVNTKQLSPPDYPLPLYLQRVIYREYRIREAPMPREVALELLCRSWESCLLSSMVAGSIESTEQVCFEKGGLYILQGDSVCQELLSRPMALEPPQKGADPIGTDH